MQKKREALKKDELVLVRIDIVGEGEKEYFIEDARAKIKRLPKRVFEIVSLKSEAKDGFMRSASFNGYVRRLGEDIIEVEFFFGRMLVFKKNIEEFYGQSE